MAKRKPPTTPWGKALEKCRLIREKQLHEKGELPQGKEFSGYQIAKDAGITYAEYHNVLHRGKDGPTIGKLERILKQGMALTWYDWAVAVDGKLMAKRKPLTSHKAKKTQEMDDYHVRKIVAEELSKYTGSPPNQAGVNKKHA